MNTDLKDFFSYIWRNCYQIVAWEKGKPTTEFPSVFGSGFVLRVEDEDIFVTADHVIHKKDHEDGLRTGQEYHYAIVNNKNVDFKSVMTPIGGFYDYTGFDIRNWFNSDIEAAIIPDELMDFAFARLETTGEYPFLTHDLTVGGEVIVEPGLEKTRISLDTLARPVKGKEYFVLGTPKNELKGGIIWDRGNALHRALSFVGESDGKYNFCYGGFVKKGEWEGLSGSPVFSCDGELVGMLVLADFDGGTDIVKAIPIDRIVDFIKRMRL